MVFCLVVTSSIVATTQKLVNKMKLEFKRDLVFERRKLINMFQDVKIILGLHLKVRF